MNLGMVGLGRMGANMTERLREHGHTIETYARTNPERTANSLVELASKHVTTESLVDWIRSTPQRDDEGDKSDGPRVDACKPSQRLRIPAEDMNCVERAANGAEIRPYFRNKPAARPLNLPDGRGRASACPCASTDKHWRNGDGRPLQPPQRPRPRIWPWL